MYGQPHCCDTLIPNPGTSGTFLYAGQPDQTYTFRVTATDHVDNATAKESGASTAAVTKYYLFGGQRVAMRVGTAVYYLHGDHLGSTSLTTDATGALVSQARFTPFGEVAWDGGTVAPTDFAFTGQRAERGLGLMDYNARFYSASLGRFISADTVTSAITDVMGYDRYMYTHNNPLKYTDKSGHCDEECEARRSQIAARANWLAKNRNDLGLDDVDILALTVDYAATFYSDDDQDSYKDFINDVASVFVGYSTGGEDLIQEGLKEVGIGEGPGDHKIENYDLGDDGYKPQFQDGDDQAHHLWFYVQVGALPVGRTVAVVGNLAHETILFNGPGGIGPFGNPFDLDFAKVTMAPPFISLGYGRSATDILLGLASSELGNKLRGGDILFSEVGDWIREHIGTGDPNARRKSNDLWLD